MDIQEWMRLHNVTVANGEFDEKDNRFYSDELGRFDYGLTFEITITRGAIVDTHSYPILYHNGGKNRGDKTPDTIRELEQWGIALRDGSTLSFDDWSLCMPYRPGFSRDKRTHYWDLLQIEIPIAQTFLGRAAFNDLIAVDFSIDYRKDWSADEDGDIGPPPL